MNLVVSEVIAGVSGSVSPQIVLKNATRPRTQPVTVIENNKPATPRRTKIDPREPLHIDAQGQLLII